MVKIDGNDIANYGAYLMRGSLASLASFPSLKEVSTNDWFEEDGLEVDLSSPALKAVDFSLKLGISGDMVESFIAFVQSTDGDRQLEVTEIGRRMTVRFIAVSCDYWSPDRKFCKITVTGSVDDPWAGYAYRSPLSDKQASPFILGSRNLADYGVRVLTGESRVSFPLSLKEGYTTESKYADGRVFHGREAPVRKHRDIVLGLLLAEPAAAAFWRNRNALLYDLVRPGERLLTYEGRTLRCYYQSCAVKSFSTTGTGLWMLCDLTLRVIGEVNA